MKVVGRDSGNDSYAALQSKHSQAQSGNRMTSRRGRTFTGLLLHMEQGYVPITHRQGVFKALERLQTPAVVVIKMLREEILDARTEWHATSPVR